MLMFLLSWFEYSCPDCFWFVRFEYHHDLCVCLFLLVVLVFRFCALILEATMESFYLWLWEVGLWWWGRGLAIDVYHYVAAASACKVIPVAEDRAATSYGRFCNSTGDCLTSGSACSTFSFCKGDIGDEVLRMQKEGTRRVAQHELNSFASPFHRFQRFIDTVVQSWRASPSHALGILLVGTAMAARTTAYFFPR